MAVYMATAVDKDMYKEIGMHVNMNMGTDTERDMNTDMDMLWMHLNAYSHKIAF